MDIEILNIRLFQCNLFTLKMGFVGVGPKFLNS